MNQLNGTIASITQFNIQTSIIDMLWGKNHEAHLNSKGKELKVQLENQAKESGLEGTDLQNHVNGELRRVLTSTQGTSYINYSLDKAAQWIQHGVKQHDETVPHIVMLQEFSPYMMHPLLAKELPDYKVAIHAPHECDPKDRDPSIHHGTAILYKDSANKLELLESKKIRTGKGEVPEHIEVSDDQKKRIENRSDGRKAAVALFKQKETGAQLAVMSEHLSGYWRGGRLKDRISGRQPGFFELKSHVAELTTFLEPHGGIDSCHCIIGHDANEDPSLAIDIVASPDNPEQANPDYRPGFLMDKGFVEAKCLNGTVSDEATEPGTDTKIDFLYLKKPDDSNLELIEDMDAFNDAKNSDGAPASDHFPRHAVLGLRNP